MKNLYNYIFWFNSYEDIWYAVPRDQYTNFFSGHLEYTGVLKSKSFDTLTYLINHPNETIIKE